MTAAIPTPPITFAGLAFTRFTMDRDHWEFYLGENQCQFASELILEEYSSLLKSAGSQVFYLS